MSEAERRRLRDTGREGLRGATSRKERTHSVFEGVRGEAKAACRGGILCGAAWGDWATACPGGGGGPGGPCPPPPPPPRLPSAEDPGMRGGLCHPVVAGLWDPRNETTPRSRVASVCFDCSAARFCCVGRWAFNVHSHSAATNLGGGLVEASNWRRAEPRPAETGRLPPRRGEEGVAIVAGRRTWRTCRRPVVDDRGASTRFPFPVRNRSRLTCVRAWLAGRGACVVREAALAWLGLQIRRAGPGRHPLIFAHLYRIRNSLRGT
jgi:hypothetical protein